MWLYISGGVICTSLGIGFKMLAQEKQKRRDSICKTPNPPEKKLDVSPPPTQKVLVDATGLSSWKECLPRCLGKGP